MTTLTLQRERWIYRQMLAVVGLLAAVVLTGCLGLLWQRQQIERTARSIRLIELEMVKEERRTRYLETRIAEIHQPLFLEAQIERLAVHLAPPRANQIVYLRERALPQTDGIADHSGIARKRSDPLTRSFDFALMDSYMPAD